MVETPETGPGSFTPSELKSFSGASAKIQVPAAFIRSWLTKGRRGFKSTISGRFLTPQLVNYLGHVSDSGLLVKLNPFLPVLFGEVITPQVQSKISVFYIAFVNQPIDPPVSVEVILSRI